MSNPLVLVLDDCQQRLRQFRAHMPWADCVETAAEAIKLLQQDFDYDYVFLDHDLGLEVYVDSDLPETGMEVVRWLLAHKKQPKAVLVHSLNTSAAIEMQKRLAESGYVSYLAQWAWENPLRVLELMRQKEQEAQHE